MVDAEVRRQIAHEHGVNFLVEASAGTGKTYSLVQRLVNGILSGVYRVQTLAAVTFTRKAAAELTGRLRLALREASTGHNGERARQALVEFDQLFVGTVHSFCARLLREHPVQAGITPGFREIEDDEDLLLQHQVLRAALDQAEGRQLMRLLGPFGAGVVELQAGLQWMCSHGELDYFDEPLSEPDLESAWAAVESFAAELEPLLPECQEAEPTCKLLTAGQNLLRRLAWSDRSRPGDLALLLERWETEAKPVQKYWGANREAQRHALETVTERVRSFRERVVRVELGRWRSYLYSRMVPFLRQVRTTGERERRLHGIVNFNDLLRLACELMQQPEVRRSSQVRFSHLCVDEFQDTDPLQARLFFLLSADDPVEQDWTRVRPRPGSLFLVGDPKQSIYRFRRADIETYNEARRVVEGTGGQVLALRTSFRSNARLCNWLNEVFGQLFPPSPSALQARHSELLAYSPSGSGSTLLRSAYDCPRHTQVPAVEAADLAGWIAGLMEQGYAASDFLILTARKAELWFYQKAFSDAQIPCQVSADPAPLSPRGRAFLRLLQVLANSQDRIALVGVLRGPLFGHSDAELFASLHQKEPNAVDESLSLLRRLREEIRVLPLGAAAQWVSQQLGLHLNSDLELDGVVDYLGSCGQRGLTLAQSLRELLEAGCVPLPPSPAGHEGVRIMNVHKAKGLEARVVVLAAPASGLPVRAEHSVWQGKGAFCLYRPFKPLAHPSNWAQIEARELEFIRAEQLRLLYVAATRARERLVVSQWTGQHASALRPWVALDPFLQAAGTLSLSDGSKPPADVPAESLADLLAREQEQAAALQQSATPSWRRHAVSANSHEPGLRAAVDLPAGEVGGSAWGDLIHRLLEQLVRQPDLNRAQLGKLAAWFAFDSPELQDHLHLALDTVEQVRASEFWQRVTGARQRLVEVPFAQRVEGDLLFGIIDLALEQEDGWDVVDYKTDRQRLETLIARYAGQVGTYAQSFASLTGEAVGYAGIYGVREARLSDDVRG